MPSAGPVILAREAAGGQHQHQRPREIGGRAGDAFRPARSRPSRASSRRSGPRRTARPSPAALGAAPPGPRGRPVAVEGAGPPVGQDSPPGSGGWCGCRPRPGRGAVPDRAGRDQPGGLAAIRPRGRRRSRAVKWNVLPRPTAPSTQIRPPIRATRLGRDRQAQPGPAVLPGGRAVGLLEGREDRAPASRPGCRCRCRHGEAERHVGRPPFGGPPRRRRPPRRGR